MKNRPNFKLRMVVFLVIFLLCCYPCRCQDDAMLLEGDITLGSIFSVNTLQTDGPCGDYDTNSLKVVVAVTWVLDKINAMNYIPGIRIGLHGYRTCQSTEMAAGSVVEMMETYNVVAGDSELCVCNSTKPLLGLLGPSRTNEAIVVSRMLGSMPEDKRLLQISGSATGEALSDRTLYPNFFRVMPPDSTQVKVLLELLIQINWNYVAIVYDDDAYGRQAATRLKALAQDRDICVPVFEALPLDYKSENFDDVVRAIRQMITAARGSGSRVKGIVFIGSATTAKEFVERVDRSFVRFVFSEGLGLRKTAIMDPMGKGALAASPPYLPLPEFKDYWSQLWSNWTVFKTEAARNPWIAGLYQQQTSCGLEDEICWQRTRGSSTLDDDISQWLFEYYQVKTAAVFAALLKKLHHYTCGAGQAGMCPGLKQMLLDRRSEIQQTLETNTFDLEEEFSSISTAFRGQTSVGFTETGDVANNAQSGSVYDVYNFQQCVGNDFCFKKVGSFNAEEELRLNTTLVKGYDAFGNQLDWPDFPTAQCQDDHDCRECLPQDISQEVVFVKGDFYFVAVAPVHSPDGSLQCGGIRNLTGANLVEGVLFALEQVNSKTGPGSIFSGIFGNKKLGVIMIDSCYNELVIKERLIDLYKGNMLLPDGTNSSSIVDSIAGFVGAYYSDISVSMYEVLSKLEKPFVMVSPTNTSPVLSDRDTYPFYMRIVTPLVYAILGLVEKLGSNYIQVIYDPEDVYSLTMKESLNELSLNYSVCVANNIPTVAYRDGNLIKVRDSMRSYSSARVVVVLLIVQHVKNLTDAILPQLSEDDDFVFIGSDGWGKRTEVFDSQNSKRLQGSLTVFLDLPLDQRFPDYLLQVDPLNSINPWLRYFWELRKACYFDGSFLRKDKTDLCPEDLTTDYKQDPWTPFYIQTVYAFALGLDAAMETHCGNRASFCDEITSDKLVESMKTVKLDLYGQGRRQQVFDDNGDGVVRIKVYEISQDSPAEPMEYKEVGRYDQGSVTLHNQEALWVVRNGIKGECPNQATCDKCFGMRAQERGEPEEINGDDGSDSDSALIATITVIVILVVIIAILVVIIVVLRRRRRPNTNGLPHLSTLNVHHSRSNAGGKQRVPVTHSLPAMHRRCSLDDLDNNGDYDYIVGKVPDEGPTTKRIATDPALRPRAPDPPSSDRSALDDRFPSGGSKSSAADASSCGVLFSLPVESLPQPEDYEPPMPAHLPAPPPQASQREFNPYLSPCKP